MGERCNIHAIIFVRHSCKVVAWYLDILYLFLAPTEDDCQQDRLEQEIEIPSPPT